MPVRTILCPVDFSAPSEEALRYGVSLAARLQVEPVHVLHVHQPPAVFLPEGTLLADGAAEIKQHAVRQLEDLCKRYSAHGVEIVPHLVEGVPYETILKEAERLGADLIVMGTHGRSGIKHVLLGSVAERVLRLSPVPVCTVRSKS